MEKKLRPSAGAAYFLTKKAAPKNVSGVRVIRTMTMPGGKSIRVLRKDTLDRALKRERVQAE